MKRPTQWQAGVLALAILGAGAVGGHSQEAGKARAFTRLKIPALDEASGLSASWRRPGVYWTHNDSPGGKVENYLYAFDKAGTQKARVQLQGAKNLDWEDMAIGPGAGGKPALYVGDIGDSGVRARGGYIIYRVPEPDAIKPPASLAVDRTWKFTFADRRRDFETLLVHPKTSKLYVVTKEKGRVRKLATGGYQATSEVFEITAGKATSVGSFRLTSTLEYGCLTTGGEFRKDGGAFVVRTYTDAYEFSVKRGETMTAALKRAPRKVALPPEPQGEAICYRLDGKAWLTCSERKFGWTTVWEIPLR